MFMTVTSNMWFNCFLNNHTAVMEQFLIVVDAVRGFCVLECVCVCEEIRCIGLVKSSRWGLCFCWWIRTQRWHRPSNRFLRCRLPLRLHWHKLSQQPGESRCAGLYLSAGQRQLPRRTITETSAEIISEEFLSLSSLLSRSSLHFYTYLEDFSGN